MALMVCPECEREISEQAKTCPHCGFPLGVVVAESVDESAEADIIPVTNKSENKAATKKKCIGLIVCIVAAICIVLAVVTIALLIKKAEDRAEYIENLELFLDKSLDGGSVAESCCNLTKQVWYDTIFEEYDSETAEYTQKNGKYHEDFNTAIVLLYESQEMSSKISHIERSQRAVTKLYQKLMHPSDEFEDCFEEVDALYDVYCKFTNLAISPDGSLNSYSDKFSEYDEVFMEHYRKLELLIPEK